jgi:putative DNA primase/helicase
MSPAHDDDDPFAGLAPIDQPGGDPAGPDPADADDPEAAGGPGGHDDDQLRALLAEGAAFDLNDDGNARRFCLYFGHDVIFVPRVGWFVWAGTHWAADRDEIAVRRKAQALSQLVKREVMAVSVTRREAEALAREGGLQSERAGLVRQGAPDGRLPEAAAARVAAIDAELAAIARIRKRLGDLRAAHRRFALQSGNSARMKSAREEASVRLSVALDRLDAAPLEINTASGVVRLSVTREGDRRYSEAQLVAHAREQLITKLAPVTYNPDAECPLFDAFFERIQPDPEMRRFLLRWFALSLTGLTEQKLAFFYGVGANGKSVLVDLMARIAGDYGATAKIESLTGTNRRGGGDATPDLVPLIGARMVRAAEPEEGVRWQEGLIKDLTGGEPILVRALHSDFVEVRPIFTLTLSGNHRPDIRGTDDGIWRRLLLVPFDVQIPKAEQRPKAELDAALFAERDGIFARLVAALCEYLETGLGEPASVLDATADFRAESDPFGTFLDDACVVSGDPADSLASREIMLAFHFWMMTRGEGAFRDRTVTLAIKDRSRRWRSARTGQRFSERKSNGARRYDGIRFADFFAADWAAAPKTVDGRAIAVAEVTGGAARGDLRADLEDGM